VREAPAAETEKDPAFYHPRRCFQKTVLRLAFSTAALRGGVEMRARCRKGFLSVDFFSRKNILYDPDLKGRWP
jgi:hypothetical protein